MNEAGPVTAAPPRRRDWAAYSAIVATLVGLLALGVSAYTALLQRQQVRAQVWPRLLLMSSETQQEMLVINKGVGPAVIRSLRVSVGGVAQRDWAMLAKTLGLKPDDYVQSTVNNVVISGGERYVMAQFPQPEVWARVGTAVKRIERRLCYCSTLEECWVVDTAPGREDGYREVDRCERVEAEEFND
ncbi:MAG TPA: hypothetical protein VLF18_08085 [Tahibacter sp.]|uniref:hypothetical protein n=1 Tax=Tahibacter sp. TaxID=2056211 RepID=UPI002B72B5B6|nr:hypothetical protein [Tahibacter sp.]HSX60141.1 hypothetical protein [Tahibacter sp.]